MTAERPRVTLLSPYWTFWERSVPGDLRADRRQLAAEAASALGDLDVVASATVAGDDDVAPVAAAVAGSGAQAVIVLASMATPPSWPLAALDAIGLPVVVWAIRREAGLRDGFDHADITSEGATVGAPQLTNVLSRRGLPFDLVCGRLGDPTTVAAVERAARAAAAAGAIRTGTLLRVGGTLPGYLAVDADDALVEAAMGLKTVRIEAAEVRDAYLAAEPDAVEAVRAETVGTFELAPGVEDDETLARSVRFAAAMEAIDERYGASAGAMNCHVPELRHADEPGITPCFALGRETSRGIPWTCTGDVVTAIAMLLARRLGGAAVYHELEALDEVSGEAVIANSGEHDLAWCDPATVPVLRRNGWFDGTDPRCGACACFSPAPGPATLVAFTAHAAEPSGFRFVVAEGRTTARTFPHTGTISAAFVFGDGSEPVTSAWARWATAGANHHSAATLGHVGDLVARAARHLGVGCAAV
jgi:L-fucose isomerase-like protein